MVLQYQLKKEGRWKDYPGKKNIKVPLNKCYFRLLSEDKKKILVKKGDYATVMKRFRQIEFFKYKGKN